MVRKWGVTVNFSGDKSLYDTVAPFLDIMGKVIVLPDNFSFFPVKIKIVYGAHRLTNYHLHFYIMHLSSQDFTLVMLETEQLWNLWSTWSWEGSANSLTVSLFKFFFMLVHMVTIFLTRSMMASFSEGILLSEKVGLDPNVLVEVVSQGAISAPMYSLKGPSMTKSLYPTAFPLKHQQKVCNIPEISKSLKHMLYNLTIIMLAGSEDCLRIRRICFLANSDCSSCEWTIQDGKISWP